MFTISCYTFHHVVKRFMVVWRYVQVVSDILTFLMSCLCCQCGALMPLSNASSSDEKMSVEAFKIMSEPIIDAGRASGEPFHQQHLVIDFTPQAGDGEEAGLKCQQFWDHLHSRPDLKGLMVSPVNEAEMMMKEIAVPVHRSPSPHVHEGELPALHSIRTLGERGALDAVFAVTPCKHNQ